MLQAVINKDSLMRRRLCGKLHGCRRIVADSGWKAAYVVSGLLWDDAEWWRLHVPQHGWRATTDQQWSSGTVHGQNQFFDASRNLQLHPEIRRARTDDSTQVETAFCLFFYLTLNYRVTHASAVCYDNSVCPSVCYTHLLCQKSQQRSFSNNHAAMKFTSNLCHFQYLCKSYSTPFKLKTKTLAENLINSYKKCVLGTFWGFLCVGHIQWLRRGEARFEHLVWTLPEEMCTCGGPLCGPHRLPGISCPI